MRKNEIKPGVVYACQRSRDGYDVPTPIVFLTAPADGTLYREANPYGTRGKLEYGRAREGTKPGRSGSGYGSYTIGYPAVTASWNATIEPQDLPKLTLPEFEQATSNYATGVDGVRFTLVASLAAITGPYDEVIAAYNARQDAERRQREQDQAKREAVRAHAADVISRLARFGAEPVSAGTSCTQPHIKLTLDDAEKLLAALNATQG